MKTILKNISRYFYHFVIRYKHITRWFFIIIVALITILLYETGIMEKFELITVDYRFVIRPPQKSASDVIFIDMAEDSIEAIGRWPWPRKWHATIVSALSEYKPKAIAFDVVFSEPQDEVDDAVFSEAIKTAKVVYLPLLYNVRNLDIEDFAREQNIASILGPIEPFRKWAKGTGHINAMPDTDGTVRRVPPVVTYKNSKTYQFGFKIGADLLGVREEDIKFYPEEHKMSLKKPDGEIIEVPLDKNNQLIINWRGKWGKNFEHYSYIDVIHSYALAKQGKRPPIDLTVLEDKICIIGLTASGLVDIKPVPIEKAYPAVSVNALAANGIIRDDFIHPTSRIVDILTIIFVTAFIVLWLFTLRPFGGIIATMEFMALYAVFSIIIFSHFNILIVTFYPMFAIFLAYISTTTYTQALQSIERAQLFKQATSDGLTKQFNIRHFTMLLEAELVNVARYKLRPLSIMLFDIDDFKKINDTYGHLVGDTVLTTVANVIKNDCRKTDVVARYGGEEFIVMLVGTKEKDAIDVAEKIRADVESRRFKYKDIVYKVTISTGVVQYSNEKTKGELIEKADKALYKAKHEGKNRVCVYKPDLG